MAISSKQRKKNKMEMQRKTKTEIKPEQNIQELWDNYKICNICIMRIPEGKERSKQKCHLKEK